MTGLPSLDTLKAAQGSAESQHQTEIERLRAAQEAAEAEAAAKLQAEAEAAAKLEAASPMLKTKETLVAESEEVKTQLKAFVKEGIEDAVAKFERADREMHERQQDLESVGEELNGHQQYLDEVRALIEGKEVISDEVAQAIEAAEAQIAEAKSRQAEVLRHIKSLKHLGSNRENVKDYRDLQQKSSEIDAKISEIESDPLVIEIMLAEKKEEEGLRSEVLQAVDNQLRRESLEPEGFELMHQVTEQFLDIVFKKFGADSMERKRELTGKILEKLSDVDPWQQSDWTTSSDAAEMNQGIILQSLLGQSGSPSLRKIWIYKQVGPYGRRIEPQEAGAELNDYYPVLNRVMAMIKGAKHPAVRSRLLPRMMDTVDGVANSDISMTLHQMGYEYNPGGKPLLPTDASTEEKQKIQEEFDKIVEQVEGMEERVLARQRKELTAERDKLLERQERLTILARLDDEYRKIYADSGVMKSNGLELEGGGRKMAEACRKKVLELEVQLANNEDAVKNLEAGRKKLLGKRPKEHRQTFLENKIIQDREHIASLRASAEDFDANAEKREALPASDSTSTLTSLDQHGIQDRLEEINRGLKNLSPVSGQR